MMASVLASKFCAVSSIGNCTAFLIKIGWWQVIILWGYCYRWRRSPPRNNSPNLVQKCRITGNTKNNDKQEQQRMTKNDQERPRRTMNEQEWTRMTKNDQEWPRMTKNDQEWQMNDQEWPRMTKNDIKWQRMTKNEASNNLDRKPPSRIQLSNLNNFDFIGP